MKEFLSQNDISFTNRDIENDPSAADEARALGIRSIPATVIGDRVVTGFSPNEIGQLIGLGTKSAVGDPRETVPLIERALAAAIEAVKQMPDGLLEWSIAQRQRPMRELAHHVFAIVSRTVEDLRAGGVPATWDTAAPPGAGFQDIADYGETVLDQVRRWAATANLDSLRAPAPAGANARSGAERLDLLAGHTIHHLRQLYSVLEQHGIAPAKRVPDSGWPAQYVLANLW
ncbi:MAG: DinB family protein [Chloroflexi bacterium]|nr:DinB family protein [Chloroflexota bacterium]